MIELTHVATGALAGRRCDGPLRAVLAGVAMHALMDVAPHGELHDEPFEVTTAVAGIITLGLRHGFDAPIVWGAVGSVLPDVEHILPERLGGPRRIFPTHRFEWLHGRGPLRVPAWLQVLLGGAIVGVLAAQRGTSAAERRRGSKQRRRGGN